MALLSLAVCALAGLTTPPHGLFEGVAYFSTYPLSKEVCPEINPNRDVIFELYTNKNPKKPQILLLGDDKSIYYSNFNFNNPTIFFFHGFLEVSEFGSPDAIRRAYLDHGGYNIILVNAKVLLAGPWYITAAANTLAVGKYTAAFIDYLVKGGLKLSKIHLIGHSLGSHSAGVCGHYLKSGLVPRITGLDPALPLFKSRPLEERLDKSDAKFVDVIHTDGGYNGFDEAIGHADFYPNDGRKTQPGCTLGEVFKRSNTPKLETLFCSHWKSFMYYAESVRNPKSFEAKNKRGYKTYMGFSTSKNARGKYYLKTNKYPPYSM